MWTYSMSKHVIIRTFWSLYLPFHCYDFVLMSFYFNCYVRRYELMWNHSLSFSSLQKDDEKATTIRFNSEKSHATPKPQPRARQSRPVIVEETQQTNQHCYKGLLDFSQRLKRIKSLIQWKTKTLEDKVVLKKMADHYVWYMCGKRCLFDNVSM